MANSFGDGRWEPRLPDSTDRPTRDGADGAVGREAPRLIAGRWADRDELSLLGAMLTNPISKRLLGELPFGQREDFGDDVSIGNVEVVAV